MAVDIDLEHAKRLVRNVMLGSTWEDLGFSTEEEFEWLYKKACDLLSGGEDNG